MAADLSDGARVTRRHGAVAQELRLHEAPADRADPIRKERRRDPNGIRVPCRGDGCGGRVGRPDRRGVGPCRRGRRSLSESACAVCPAGAAAGFGGRLMNNAGAMAMAIINRIAQIVRRSMASGHVVRGQNRSHREVTDDIERAGGRPANALPGPVAGDRIERV